MLPVDLVQEYLLIAKHTKRKHAKIAPPQSWCVGDKGHIIIIPGWHGSYHSLFTLADALNKEGFCIHTLQNVHTTDKISAMAEALYQMIISLPKGEVTLIAHSKGGIVEKYLLDNFPDIVSSVKNIISIATPFKGTVFGNLKFHNVEELKPDSDIIKNLKRERIYTNYYNFYPTWDNHVLPNESLLLEGAHNIQININGHTRVLESPELIDKIKAVLA